MQRYFFDVTDIMLYVEKETTVSGIQRVSLEVIKRMLQLHGPDNVKICIWNRRLDQYIALNAGFLADMDEFDADVLSTVFFGKKVRRVQDSVPMLSRYRNKPLKYWFHSTVANYQAFRSNEAYFGRRNSTISDWQEAKAIISEGRIEQAPSENESRGTRVADLIRPEDQIVVLGATWGLAGLEGHLKRLKDKFSIKISMLIHDLIPIVKPEHLANDFSLEFYRWLEQSTSYCSLYFVNSKNTGRDLKAFMEEIKVDRPIQTVALAQALGRTTSTSPNRLSNMKARCSSIENLNRFILNLSKVPYVLVVGSMESRKNLWRLAQAWERLVQQEELEVPKLVFAGKTGWYNDDFFDWMAATGNMNGWIQFADRPSDSELAFLYKNCEFTATVSLYEGWGLPIGESLSFGKTAVVADNSSMPEVGGDMVEYCSADSINSIYTACHRLIADPDHRKELERRILATQLRSWDDVASELVSHLEQNI